MFSQKTYFVDVCLDPYYASAVEIFTINWGTLVIVDLEIFRKIFHSKTPVSDSFLK